MCHDITTNQYFEGFITVCILFHIVVLATQSPQQSSTQTFVLVIIHWMVTGVYSLEFVLQTVAQSPLGEISSTGFSSTGFHLLVFTNTFAPFTVHL